MRTQPPGDVDLVSPEPCEDANGLPNIYDVACKVRWDTSGTTHNLIGTTMLTPIALLVTTIFRPTMRVSMELEMLPDPKDLAFQEDARVMRP
jgi:hypothetical protein